MVALTSPTTNHRRAVRRQRQLEQGVVLDLTLKGDGIWNAIYTLDIAVGTPQVTFPILVDTGSSDIWIASISCGTPECKQSGQTLWNPEASSTHRASTVSFQLPYLQGSVKGPVYWDTITIGGYQISNQAIAAATEVANEPLNVGFSGLIGLALPRNSVIAQLLPPGVIDGPDGASVAANLFGQPTAPTNHFFAISLSRPGFDNRIMSWHAWPSKLALGTHIPEVVNELDALRTNSSSTTALRPRSFSSFSHARQSDRGTNDPAQLVWAQILPAPSGYLHWRTQISEIIVTDNQGIEKSIALSRSLVDGGQSSLWPVAVLDTGGSNILMRSDLANGLYGAIGIGPASDGMYYVPCKTPVTVSITIGQIRLPLHPLDMSFPPSNDASSTSCVGAIQANPSIDQGKLPGDIILGIPFLRNVYVVHALGSGNGTSPKPRFGVASLTNAALAATEFRNVRLMNLNPDGSSNGPNVNSLGQPTEDGMKTAVKIGIGILCFVVACGVLFGILWWSMHRRLRQEQRHTKEFHHARLGGSSNFYRILLLADEGTNKTVKTQDKRGFFERLFIRKGYSQAGKGEAVELTEDALRMQRFEEYKRRRAQEERDSICSQGTQVRDTLVEDDHHSGHKAGWNADEFGYPLDPLDEQRGRQMKYETCSSGSTRSRTLSPEPVAADQTFIPHRPSSRERPDVIETITLEFGVSRATPPAPKQPVRTLGHARIPLAVEPSLSPLTEAVDSQLVTPVSTAFQHSIESYPDVHRPASPAGRVSLEATDPDFTPVPTPARLSATFTTLRADTPLSTLHSPRPLLPTHNPHGTPLLPTGTPIGVEPPSVISGSLLKALPPRPVVIPSGRGPAGPPGLSPYMEVSTDPSQWKSIPSAPWPWGVPSPVLAPSNPTTPQFAVSHSLQPVARPLAHGPLPRGAAPPMSRQQSIELSKPASSPSTGFYMPLLPSCPPNTPPANVALSRTTSATVFPLASPPNVWLPPPISTGTPTIETAAPMSEVSPLPIPPPLPSKETIGNLVIAPGGM